MPIPDELLDYLGVQFHYRRLREYTGWTFEQFVDRWMRGKVRFGGD